ncbi:PREDICTED: death-inducer obliterator 1-like [Galeopterus variegatus]|uniref:Death-inducer obliterator 1-like n=1 Tax=Galeopterus variegatus TaxID=482537 RepID=A0ABM0S551_GALVR|nr:PREDICTED: death-inducer obliterator 1-like [Galeopterus variegatus]
MVWDYVGELKSSVSKELCLIRFHPLTEEDEVAYDSLYSYFSSRGRFGVVPNKTRHIKNLYLIPLGAKDPIPSALLPFEGPGLESPRPNIILGLVICHKIKRPSSAGELDKIEKKWPRLQQEVDVSIYPKITAAPRSEEKPCKCPLYAAGTAVGTAPTGSPPPPPSLLEPSELKIQSSIKPKATHIVTASTKRAAATTAASSVVSPLETILRILFGKKKSFEPPAKESVGALPSFHQDSNTKADDGVSTAPCPDPTVEQFGQFSKAQAVEEEEEDQPHSPEEEQNLERALDAQLAKQGTCHDVEEAPESSEREEVACDPEDETVLEVKVTIEDLPNRMCADGRGSSSQRPAEHASDVSTPSLLEQQKMSEKLNKPTEEQERQLEEQEEALRQQRVTVGASVAHFSVSNALMSPGKVHKMC